MSDPDNFKGIRTKASVDSIPRIIGWLQWAMWMYQLRAWNSNTPTENQPTIPIEIMPKKNKKSKGRKK